MSKNTMYVNDEEVEYTDEQMRDFYESFVEGMSKTMYNPRKHWRVKSAEYRDEIKRLQDEIKRLNELSGNSGQLE